MERPMHLEIVKAKLTDSHLVRLMAKQTDFVMVKLMD